MINSQNKKLCIQNVAWCCDTKDVLFTADVNGQPIEITIPIEPLRKISENSTNGNWNPDISKTENDRNFAHDFIRNFKQMIKVSSPLPKDQ